MSREVPLTRGFVALVDDNDYERVMAAGAWWTDSHPHTSYAMRLGPRPRRESILMHRLILDAQLGEQVDHVNRNGLDNRRANLRLCSQSQNNANRPARSGTSSKYKGVTWSRSIRRWTVQAGHGGYVGCFPSEEDAARAYDVVAKNKWGEFALLNFPEGASNG